jgi:hypothetical protein
LTSREASEHPEQKLQTKGAGKHKHGGVPGRDNPWEIGGDIASALTRRSSAKQMKWTITIMKW